MGWFEASGRRASGMRDRRERLARSRLLSTRASHIFSAGRDSRPVGERSMLNIFGPKHRFCDGVTRRNFLKIGGLAMGGLGLADLLRLEARASQRPSPHKAIIMVFLPGGPPHQDM